MSQIQIYLKLKLKQNGLIAGSATAPGHAGDLLIDSFSWSESIEQAPAGGRLGSGSSLSVKDFEFTMAMNQASPLIMLGSLMMDPVLQATLACHHQNTKGTGDFITWTLKNGIISSYETVCTGESILPRDRFRIRFRSVGLDFRIMNPDFSLGTTISAQFDLGSMTSGGGGGGGGGGSSASAGGGGGGAASPGGGGGGAAGGGSAASAGPAAGGARAGS